jgi:hypothetical protein
VKVLFISENPSFFSMESQLLLKNPSDGFKTRHFVLKKNKYVYSNSLPDRLGALGELLAGVNAESLRAMIGGFKPHVVHSSGFGTAGQLIRENIDALRSPNVPWIVSPSREDVFFSPDLPRAPRALSSILKAADYFWGETFSDNSLAKSFGFGRTVLAPVTRLEWLHIRRCRNSLIRHARTSVSARKTVVLEVDDDPFTRAFMGLRALIESSRFLKGRRILLWSQNPKSWNLQVMAAVFRSEAGLPVEISSDAPQARIWISLSSARGLSCGMAQAVSAGAFPIFSSSSAMVSLVHEGNGGFVVDAMDLDQLKRNIRRALSDDRLVDRAARLNSLQLKGALDPRSLREQIYKNYREAARL